MPSLFQDAPVAPILPAAIIRTITDLLTPHAAQSLPSWWQETGPLLTDLIALGAKVSSYPSAQIVWRKHQHIHDCVQQIDAVHSIIKYRLLRSVRNQALSECAAAHLTLFLGVVDAWLRSCEEYLQDESARYPNDITAFNSLYYQLGSLAKPRLITGLHAVDNLVHLFDMLQERHGHESEGHSDFASIQTPSLSND
ncbi:hypothetical protein IF1G_10950 [Cordyceps javanica]|uniref:Uncharacterized protein n=1 Tax=Cordyceps javanica TaxID=43265 RepID=A0A545VI10_9HYPO|nr:hypothetical protein IF1G_10950 [Cordyceps javanica]TQW01372.1 hypothetical protein IF2G_11105 [Cordyceps javanica]